MPHHETTDETTDLEDAAFRAEQDAPPTDDDPPTAAELEDVEPVAAGAYTDPNLEAIDGDAGAPAGSELLERNGFNAIRTSTLGAAQAAGSIPAEAIEAAIAFAQRAIPRLRVSRDPQAAQALRQAEYELRILNAVRIFRRELGRIDEAQAARDRLNVNR